MDLAQYGIVGACATFMVFEAFRFAKWSITRRDARESEPPKDDRIGEILDRLTTIETQLTERQEAQQRLHQLVEEIDGRLRHQEIKVASIRGRTNGRGA